jgi:hypothetical protein
VNFPFAEAKNCPETSVPNFEAWCKVVPKKAAVAQKKASRRKPMSPAMRKKLAAMMEARWAEKKGKA